eukprot:859470-Rhodomonas_salina.6
MQHQETGTQRDECREQAALFLGTALTNSLGRANAVGWSLHHTDLGHGKVPQLSSRCNQRRRLELFAAMEVIEPSYNLAVGATVLGTAFGVYDLRTPRPTIHSIPGLIFGLLLLYQTSLHRCVANLDAIVGP